MNLHPILKLDGEWLDAGAAAKRGLVLAQRTEHGIHRVTLENRSGATVRPEELGWRKEGRDDFDVPGLKLYVESWQMASPCGVRRWDDEPFDYSQEYLKNCVSTPADFHPGERGRFLSDNMCCLRRPDGAMRLFGFTTGADRFGHFAVKLVADGVETFSALCACDRAELPNVCRNVVNHAYLNGRLWINDPDTLIVRDDNTALTQSEVELWACAVSLAGGSLLLSDRMATLTPERLALARRALSETGTWKNLRPTDRWERTPPTIWEAEKDDRPVRAVFDFGGTHGVTHAVRHNAG